MTNDRIIYWNKLKKLTHPHKPAIPFFTSKDDIKKEYDRILNANKPKIRKKYEKSIKQMKKEAHFYSFN